MCPSHSVARAAVRVNPTVRGLTLAFRAPTSHEMPGPRVLSQMRLPPFQELLDAHGQDVFRFLVATVGDVDAEDCYQETWISALRAYPRLRERSIRMHAIVSGERLSRQ